MIRTMRMISLFLVVVAYAEGAVLKDVHLGEFQSVQDEIKTLSMKSYRTTRD
jgi:hypothetical protein